MRQALLVAGLVLAGCITRTVYEQGDAGEPFACESGYVICGVPELPDGGAPKSTLATSDERQLQYAPVCADLQADPLNCGACGASCGGGDGTCTAGRCDP